MFLQFSAQLSTAGVSAAAGLFFCSCCVFFFFSWLPLFLLLWVFNFLSHILSWMYSCHLFSLLQPHHLLYLELLYWLLISCCRSSSCLTLSSSCHIISPPTALTWLPPPPLGLAGPSFYPSWLRMAFFSLLRITDLMICNGFRFLGCWVPVIFLKILQLFLYFPLLSFLGFLQSHLWFSPGTSTSHVDFACLIIALLCPICRGKSCTVCA